jgi:peptidoglycan/xylan/chitin deacetylase (PgdA/CDA1 family)|tara:strand:- start:692 stop:1627 length:936 start_codon:yes stop_codon:yes gene_type:complete
MKYTAVSLHLDSLGHGYGFPQRYKDPTFFEVSERFLKIAQKYNFKYTIYIIGKDLEKSENRERVNHWASEGHEIGNHSWLHLENLGALNKSIIRREVEAAHEIITKIVGREPKGFVAPAWTSSSQLEKILIELNYKHDSSGFPSWILFPALLKILLSNLKNAKSFKIFHRKDYLYWLFGPRNPYNNVGNLFKACDSSQNKHITMLPVPTNKYRVAFWHTLVFMFGWDIYEKLLKSCLKENFFYFVIHPADLMDERDLTSDFKPRINIARIKQPSLAVKMEYIEKSIELIIRSGRKIITMGELAAYTSSQSY